HGVNQRRLDGRAQLDRLFHVDGEALQDDVENTASLAGLDHVGGQVVEDIRILAHGIGQRGTTFDGGPDPEQRFLEAGILLVGAENLQALDQWQAGVNHDGELAEEYRDILDLDLAGAKGRQGKLLALLPDGAWRDALLAELGGEPVLGGGYALSLNFLARSVLSRKRKNWHVSSLLLRIPSAWFADPTGAALLVVFSFVSRSFLLWSCGPVCYRAFCDVIASRALLPWPSESHRPGSP